MVEGNRHLLAITEAFPKDAGTYTAVARNAAGEATSTCNLAVKVMTQLFNSLDFLSNNQVIQSNRAVCRQKHPIRN